ncbi:I78 family peptidase inhibitor [Thalassorhabdomicrobium marinisediminis]|uniref:Peptidase inhibitor I78 family protein n=1 Tax=Thalassorhabdomicrobium marinisediminis TaxID=2170577 RepID=A0A2T7FVS2_9RHOB|nr:I78 family peptidase inhibitor [Thalassorhabdomicrobium marinisediminis]PVA06286.1 hypothetical protein DC363_10275 [Thalassorhabdomicrobium marinisediminis]
MNKIFMVPLIFLTACASLDGPAQQPTGPAVPAPADDTCNAAQHAGLVGQDATALERVLLMGPVRIIRPGDAVTMDFRPERINFHIDDSNRITSITCT